MDESRQLGERINRLMRAQRMQPGDLARELDLGESSIRKVLRGENVAQYIQLARIARALKTTPNFLLGFTDAHMDAGRSGNIDLSLLQAAFQGILEQLGLDRDAASVGAQLAFETAQEQTVVGEDPLTRVSISQSMSKERRG